MTLGVEQAMIGFNCDTMKIYSVNVGIVEREPSDRGPMPLVLGIDVMSRWQMFWEPRPR